LVSDALSMIPGRKMSHTSQITAPAIAAATTSRQRRVKSVSVG